MDDLSLIEEYYEKFTTKLSDYTPEGVVEVDLEFLTKFDLLKFFPGDSEESDPPLTQYFHMIETPEKITLLNDKFIIWIIPNNHLNISSTLTLIALNQGGVPKVETAFACTGVYNTSQLVLRVLEKFLFEIEEVESILSHYREAS